MKTIKFRAWDNFNECYYFSDNYKNLAKFFDFCQQCINAENQLIFERFIELSDKNGKELYEGDIVNWGMHHPNSEEHFHRYAVVEINPDIQFRILFYINSANGNKKETDGYIFRFGQFAYKETNKHLEVIGNINENPELL